MRRTGGWAGIVGSVMFVVGTVMASDQPDAEAESHELLDFYANNGNMDRVTFGAILVFAACAILLYFFLALGQHLGTSTMARYVSTGGAIFVALAALGVAALASGAAASTFSTVHIQSLDVIYYAQSLGYGTMLIAAPAFGGLAVVAAGIAGRAGAFAPWLCWTSIVVGVIVALGSVIFLPLGLLFIWIIVVSVVLMRSGRGESAPAVS